LLWRKVKIIACIRRAPARTAYILDRYATTEHIVQWFIVLVLFSGVMALRSNWICWRHHGQYFNNIFKSRIEKEKIKSLIPWSAHRTACAIMAYQQNIARFCCN
jgi:hypothetical protein